MPESETNKTKGPSSRDDDVVIVDDDDEKQKNTASQAQPSSNVVVAPQYTNEDYLFGNHASFRANGGNKLVQTLVEETSDEYEEAHHRFSVEIVVPGTRKRDKMTIKKEIIAKVKENGGRFLKYQESTSSWVEVSDKDAFTKLNYLFRCIRTGNKKSPRKRKSHPEVHLYSTKTADTRSNHEHQKKDSCLGGPTQQSLTGDGLGDESKGTASLEYESSRKGTFRSTVDPYYSIKTADTRSNQEEQKKDSCLGVAASLTGNDDGDELETTSVENEAWTCGGCGSKASNRTFSSCAICGTTFRKEEGGAYSSSTTYHGATACPSIDSFTLELETAISPNSSVAPSHHLGSDSMPTGSSYLDVQITLDMEEPLVRCNISS